MDIKVTTLWMWFVINWPSSSVTTSPVVKGSPRKDIPARLVDGSFLYQGRVEIQINGEWGGVCADGWGMGDANVLCRQLGFPGAQLAYVGSSQVEGTVLMGQADCKGDEASLGECRHRGRGDCSANKKAAAWCVEAPLPVRTEDMVEVLYDGEWIPVCQGTGSVTTAEVLCRQLGFQYLVHVRARHRPAPGPEDSRGGLFLNLDCRGREEHLAQCPSNGPQASPCPVAQVVCSNDNLGRPGGIIRLTEGGGAGGTGQLQVNFRGEWWTVCSQGFDLTAADLACRQLGYQSASAVRSQVVTGGRLGFSQVSCQGTEETFAECQHHLDKTYVCPAGNLAVIACSDAGTTILPDYQVRLVGGSFPYEGRVEVSYNGQWGTVCDDSWGYVEADVVCQQLGYYTAEAVASAAYFGEGSGPILLDDVACLGNETSIGDCPHAGVGEHNCNHNEDAGIRCYENKTLFTVLPSGKNDSILPLIVILINGLIALLILFGCLVYCYLKIWDRYTGHTHRARLRRGGQDAGAGQGGAPDADIPLEFTEEPPPYHTVHENRSVYVAQRSETPPPEYSEAMKLQAEVCV